MVMADSINSFKSRLDSRHVLPLHDSVYDYRAQSLTSGSTMTLSFRMIEVTYGCVIGKVFRDSRKTRLPSLLPMFTIDLTYIFFLCLSCSLGFVQEL